MKSYTVEQQIDNLRPFAKSSLGLNFHNWLLVSAVVLVILSIFLWNPVPLMVAIFLSVVGISERNAGPNIVAAIDAYDTNKATQGKVVITISCSSDDDHYYALVQEIGQLEWGYEFIPQGWQPLAGSYPARIWRAGTRGTPILTVVESGVLIPRYNPTKFKDGLGGA